MKRIQAKNGFMLVKTGIEESGLPFIVITRAISGPDNSDFSDWKELPEQEALELQEKYNNMGIGILIKILGIPINKGTPNKDSNNEKSR